MAIFMKDWSDRQLMNFDRQLCMMENELLQLQKEKFARASCSFSYYLYGKRVERNRSVWERMRIGRGAEVREQLYLLASDRISHLIKQEIIVEEDFPRDEKIKEMRREHYELCTAWVKCMLFMEPEPE